MSHPRQRLDDLVHQPVRFSIIATLAAAEEAEFAFVRDAVEISDSVLSRQATVLEQAGYVHIRKGYVGKRPRTWLSLTRAGRGAFDDHVAALRELVNGAGGAAAPPGQAARDRSAPADAAGAVP